MGRNAGTHSLVPISPGRWGCCRSPKELQAWWGGGSPEDGMGTERERAEAAGTKGPCVVRPAARPALPRSLKQQEYTEELSLDAPQMRCRGMVQGAGCCRGTPTPTPDSIKRGTTKRSCMTQWTLRMSLQKADSTAAGQGASSMQDGDMGVTRGAEPSPRAGFHTRGHNGPL